MIRPLITFSPGTLGIVSRAPCPPPARGPGGRRRRRLRWLRVAYFNGIDFSEHWEGVTYLRQTGYLNPAPLHTCNCPNQGLM